jgi:glc operon protein GlcG
MPEPYGMSISLDSAQKAAAAAIAAARKNGWLMAVAITDPSGELVYFAKMDGTQTGSVNVSIGKSRSAALFKRPTKVFQDMLASGGAGVRVLALERAVPIEGGVPLVINGEIVGGIGASGGSSDQDGVVAGAGAAALIAGS